jgi:hypothetical protein
MPSFERFYADQKAHEELEDMREKMAKIEKMLSVMAELPGFGNLMEEAAKSIHDHRRFLVIPD